MGFEKINHTFGNIVVQNYQRYVHWYRNFINRDSTCGGWYNQTETRIKAVDGSRKLTITDKNADGTEIRQVTTAYSIDGLTKTISTDLDSNLTADRSVTDTLVNNANGIGEATNDNQQPLVWLNVKWIQSA